MKNSIRLFLISLSIFLAYVAIGKKVNACVDEATFDRDGV